MSDVHLAQWSGAGRAALPRWRDFRSPPGTAEIPVPGEVSEVR